MKNIPSLLIAAALLVGCTTPISDSTLAAIESTAQTAASFGVAADLLLHKEHKPAIVALQGQLEALIATGTVTSAQLASIIVGKLPLDPSYGQYFQGTLVLWGIFPQQWLAPNINAASMRAAQGLVTGIKLGLTSVPTKAAPAFTWPPPKPTAENVRRF
jgi:hypothetical protein